MMTVAAYLAVLSIGAGVGVFLGGLLSAAKSADLEMEIEFLRRETDRLRTGRR